MLDLKFVRENPEIVKENIRKKFQDHKLELVDQVIELDKDVRALKGEVEQLRARRNQDSQKIGLLMRDKKIDEANQLKAEMQEINKRITTIDEELTTKEAELKKIMMIIPNIIDPSVPVGKDDSENVEIERFLEPKQYDFEVPYHLDIIEKVGGIDLDSARRVAGNGFYYLMGDIARLHSAVLAYARDFMINKGFTYVIPPYMIRGGVVDGVMSFADRKSVV